MAIEMNSYVEEVADGQYVEKIFTVTISLEEYRSLVQENIRKEERISWLESEIDRLYAEISKLSAPKGCVDECLNTKT